MKNLTYILPVIENNKELLNTCLESLSFNDGEILHIVGPSNVIDKVDTTVCGSNANIVLIENDEKTDYISQVNVGVKRCKTTYFSIIQFDDKYSKKWTEHVEEYTKHFTDVSVFLPLIELYSDKFKHIVGLSNELSWSTSYVNELGYIDNDALTTFYDFNICGGVFKTEDFIECGCLKPSLKIASVYELLLRMCELGKKIYVIPKIGYTHTVERENSFTTLHTKEISKEEGEWLIKTAQEEKYFKEDRNKIYKK